MVKPRAQSTDSVSDSSADTAPTNTSVVSTRPAFRHYLITRFDKIAVLCFLFGWMFNLAYEANVIWHYQMRGLPFSYVFPGYLLFATVQIFWNLIYVMKADNRVHLSTETQPGTAPSPEVCTKCNIRVGAVNAVHCSWCASCIKAQDFHCWFVGNCIGEMNRSHFLLLIAHLWTAAYVENVYNLQFVCDILGCNMNSYMALCLPQFPFLLRNMRPSTIAINFLTFVGLLSLIFSSLLLYKQATQTLSGKMMGRSDLQQTSQPRYVTPSMLSANVRSALGKHWYLAFMCPAVVPSASKSHKD